MDADATLCGLLGRKDYPQVLACQLFVVLCGWIDSNEFLIHQGETILIATQPLNFVQPNPLF